MNKAIASADGETYIHGHKDESFQIWNQHKPPRRQEKGWGSCLLPSVAPISIVPFTWLKHHSVSWVSAPTPESDTRRLFRLGSEFPIALKRSRRRETRSEIHAFLVGGVHTRYHLVTEETPMRPGRMVGLQVPGPAMNHCSVSSIWPRQD